MYLFLKGGTLEYLGPEGKDFYEQAAKQGKLKVIRIKLDELGDGDAGKSCLADSILDQPYVEGRASTNGVLMRVALRMAVGLKGELTEVSRGEMNKELQKIFARGCVTHSSEPKITKPEEGDGNDVDCEITMGLDEFLETFDMDEDKESFIQQLLLDVEKLRQCEELVIITLMDRGGQDQFLSIHAALMADDSYNASAYFVVMDITKPLDEEITVSYYRCEDGRVIEQKHEARTRADVIRYYATAIDAAHVDKTPSHSFLGKNHGVKCPPAVFIVVTRKDQIDQLGEEFVAKQERLLHEVIYENEKFASHLVPSQNDPYKVVFYVDNTKSGSGDPDPVVVQLREMTVQMARDRWDKEEETPLSYVVLEIGLRKLTDLPNSKGKVLELRNVFGLAKRVCGLSPGKECTTALRYLSNMGAICFYHEVPRLNEKVFPDPQWLGNAMTVFVTVLGEGDVEPSLWFDLRKLHSEGLMTWNLAKYLLNKAEIPESVQEAILLVLQLFNIIAPSFHFSLHVNASVEVGHDFFVPCMVLDEFSGPLAYLLAIGSKEFPPSIFLTPKRSSAFLKPLFSRLVCRLISKYGDDPLLKRHQVVLHLPDELELELVYTTKAVICTAYPADPSEPPSQSVLQQHCSSLRVLLIEELILAKRRGMDGFQFEACIHPVATHLDYERLVCIDNYPTKRTLTDKRKRRVTKRQCPKLSLWFRTETDLPQGMTFYIYSLMLHMTRTLLGLIVAFYEHSLRL